MAAAGVGRPGVSNLAGQLCAQPLPLAGGEYAIRNGQLVPVAAPRRESNRSRHQGLLIKMVKQNGWKKISHRVHGAHNLCDR